ARHYVSDCRSEPARAIGPKSGGGGCLARQRGVGSLQPGLVHSAPAYEAADLIHPRIASTCTEGYAGSGERALICEVVPCVSHSSASWFCPGSFSPPSQARPRRRMARKPMQRKRSKSS